MKKIIKFLKRTFHISIVRAFGFFIAHENDYTVSILFICIGIEINFEDLFGKENQKTI